MSAISKSGKVWLVGAGPGDPELLTLKALRAIQSADLILFDHLLSAEIRALFPAQVPAFYVGKRAGAHSIAQRDLNQLLVRQARAGKQVCRLKGGDPFIFGRGGEELLTLARAGVAAEVVPGITAAAGAAAAAGIPLTQRGLAQGCTLVTGTAEQSLGLDWRALASLNHTLVFYMGVAQAGLIERELLAAGLAPTTPAAFIENATRPQQRLIAGQLAGLAALGRAAAVSSPALIVVGEVVTLAPALAPALAAAPLPERLTA